MLCVMITAVKRDYLVVNRNLQTGGLQKKGTRGNLVWPDEENELQQPLKPSFALLLQNKQSSLKIMVTAKDLNGAGCRPV